MVARSEEVTQLLQAWAGGSEAAREAVLPLVYGELKRIARRRLGRGETPTLDATGLAHEAYLRLADQRRTDWQSRRQFYALAARLMRRVLVDRHRARTADKRGGNRVRVTLTGIAAEAVEATEVAELNRALDKLSLQDVRQAQVVELRYFGGLSVEETAAVLEVSRSTVKREWTLARAWLKRELARGD